MNLPTTEFAIAQSHFRIAKEDLDEAKKLLTLGDAFICHPNPEFRMASSQAHEKLFSAFNNITYSEYFGMSKKILDPVRDEIMDLMKKNK